ncbi:hypothetical protein CR513_45857, partial [Mucuna pruriens]
MKDKSEVSQLFIQFYQMVQIQFEKIILRGYALTNSNINKRVVEKNKTLEIVKSLLDIRLVGCKWIYTLKSTSQTNNTLDRYKGDLWLRGKLRDMALIMRKHLSM